ncbi:MAG: helix-turn-helix domain-containing protein, partial [Thermomicrobiales bacterium]|nr:helix-turn-helix domain-containing protein [Thermomicrobiales bacterium]
MTTSHEPAATEALRAFGQLLRRLRHAADLTQEQLAERALVSPRSISELERGSTHWPRIDTINLLADGLELAGAERAAFVGLARGRYAPDAAAVPESPAVRLRAPAPPTPIIGREAERAAALATLRDPQVRLLTLVGPGGVGKTRLALELAQHAAPAFPDGVQFVDLAPLRDPAFLYDAIAQALELPLDPAIPLQRALAQTLQERAMLLILDNFEQIAPAAPAVAYLLSGCPRLRLLVTSRLPLRVRAEHVFPVEPLALPDPGADPSLADLADVPAVALFVNRAAAASPGFALTAQNARAVAHITQRLDGLPLAIELAAARVKALALPDLLNRLERRLPLLTGGPRDAPARLRTMRSAIAWSYDLLDADEQRLFRHLAICAGGFTLAAAEGIGEPDTPVLDLLASLVDKSLLGMEGTDGETRYRPLETIREFGLEQLAASGEHEAASRRHAAWYRAFAVDAGPRAKQADAAVWLPRLRAEHQNLLAALTWFQHQEDGVSLLQVAAALSPFWQEQNHFAEGLRWLEPALLLGQSAPAVARLRALSGAGTLAWYLTRVEQAAAWHEQALALARAEGDHLAEARALGDRSWLLAERGDLPGAIASCEASLALARAAGVADPTALVLHNLACFCRMSGDLARADACAAEALSVARAEGWDWLATMVLVGYAYTALELGESNRAASLLQEALALGDRRGDLVDINTAL